MTEWAALQQQNGRLLVGASPSVGGDASGAVVREWARRRAEQEK